MIRSVVIGICPYCAGLGELPEGEDWGDGLAEMVKCERCDGTGDLDAYRLMFAYERGRRDVIEILAIAERTITPSLDLMGEMIEAPTTPMTGKRLQGLLR